jgi:Protein of unknown function (DUF1264)
MHVMQRSCWTALGLLAACGGSDVVSNLDVAGESTPADVRALAAGAARMQARAPIDALDTYVDGFHFYNGNLELQVEAHHFCSALNEDVRQCVIFDGNGRDAKLMGIEYIVSRRVFEQLPADERKLWHSHVYEVKSGTLVAPGLPEAAEHEFMEGMVDTYGKTWHTWHTDEDQELPTGHPVLMAGFTDDDQLDPDLLIARDQHFGISASDKRRARKDIASPSVANGADAWQHGEVLQLSLQPTLAQTGPAHEPRDTGRDDAVTEPTRRLRGTRVRQLYAVLPAPPEQ